MDETELLFTQTLGCDRAALYLNKEKSLNSGQAAFISAALKRRMKGEPIQYILGKTEFMGLEFKVDRDVLIPRPETEILVETSLSYLGTPNQLKRRVSLKVLDLGTGSGCIAVSLVKMLSNVDMTATDVSLDALNIAKENARINGVQIKFICSELFKDIPADYDLIISNPPYVPYAQIRKLSPELRYEPFIALNGGSDGLEFYRRIIKEAPDYLRDNGILIMEIGFNQRKGLESIFRNFKCFNIINIVKDYNGIDRVIAARKGRKKWIS